LRTPLGGSWTRPGNGAIAQPGIACTRPSIRAWCALRTVRGSGLAGDGIQFARAVEGAIRERLADSLNIDGALAAILVDIGLPSMVGKLMFIVGRVAGLSAEVLEGTRVKADAITIP
jgi:hypothetical protein